MIVKMIFAFASTAVLSCGTATTKSENSGGNSAAEIQAEKMEAKQMMADGYLPGRIVYSNEAGDCPYTIQLKDDQMKFYYVDPINLEENFKEDQQTVWVKFNGLKRMNRCVKANPVYIEAIQKRAE